MSFCRTCWSFFKHKKAGAVKQESITSGTCWVDGTKTRAGWGCGMHSDNYPKHHSEIAPDRKEEWFSYTSSLASGRSSDQ